MPLDLRYYQRAAIDALYGYWANGGGNGLIVLPTGAGKALVIATVINELLAQYPTMRILNVTHSKTLVGQNYQEFVALSPFAPAGIYSAGLGRKDSRAQVLFAGIQSVANSVADICRARTTVGGEVVYDDPVDLVLIDEAHAISRNSDTLYGKFFAAIEAANPNSRRAGLTATDYRLDSGRLTDGDDRLFDDVVYEISIRELIEQGFLAPLSSKAGDVMIDVAGIHKRGGEFIPGELEAASDKIEITRAAVKQAIRAGQDRKAWLFFCSGQDHSEHVRDELVAQGIPAASLTSRVPAAEQRKIIEDFKTGRIRALASANMLTTGFNVPHIDLISMLRPTASAGLYVQSCGRGTRLAPGKKDCLILDHAGNVARHGPVDMVQPKKPGEKGGEAPVKLCPDCAEIVHISVMVCPCCGYEFPPSEEVKITASPSSAPVLSTDDPWQPVLGQTYAYHDKVGGTPSVRCEYTLDNKRVEKTWICPEHGGPEFTGRAKAKADRYWRYHGGNMPFPETVDEFLDRVGELNVTAQIKVKYIKRGLNDVTEWQPGEGKVDSAPVGNLDLRPNRLPANDNHANDNLSLLGRLHADSRSAEEDFIPF